MVTIHPPVRLVGEPKKTKKKGRNAPKQWQTGYSLRPPTSSNQNQTLHGEWSTVCSYTYQVSSTSVNGLRRCGGSKNGHSPLLWPVAYTTACTTLQAVISSLNITGRKHASMQPNAMQWLIFSGFVQKYDWFFMIFQDKIILYFPNFSRYFISIYINKIHQKPA